MRHDPYIKIIALVIYKLVDITLCGILVDVNTYMLLSPYCYVI